MGFPGGAEVESSCNAEDTVSIPGTERSPGKGNGNPLQYSILVCEIPWTGKPGGIQSMGSQKSQISFSN